MADKFRPSYHMNNTKHLLLFFIITCFFSNVFSVELEDFDYDAARATNKSVGFLRKYRKISTGAIVETHRCAGTYIGDDDFDPPVVLTAASCLIDYVGDKEPGFEVPMEKWPGYGVVFILNHDVFNVIGVKVLEAWHDNIYSSEHDYAILRLEKTPVDAKRADFEATATEADLATRKALITGYYVEHDNSLYSLLLPIPPDNKLHPGDSIELQNGEELDMYLDFTSERTMVPYADLGRMLGNPIVFGGYSPAKKGILIGGWVAQGPKLLRINHERFWSIWDLVGKDEDWVPFHGNVCEEIDALVCL